MPSLARKIGFALLSTITLWLLAEGVVSVAIPLGGSDWESAPSAQAGGTPTMPGNPYLIYEYRPGKHVQAGAPVTINSLGLRGEEPPLPPPDGERRFLTVGDSSIFGFGVSDEQVFSEVAQAKLGAGVSGWNAAIPGYSTYQSINLLKMRAMALDPDLLVIGNLWSDNNFDSLVDKEVLASYETYAGSLSGRARKVLERSPIFKRLDRKLRIEPAEQRIDWMRSGNPQAVLGGGGRTGKRRVAINDYAANLEALVGLAQAAGAEVVFLMPANNEDLDGGASTNLTQGKAWDPYRQVMKDAAARHCAPLIDVPALFLASGLPKDQLFLDEMHPTVAGHRLMGEALAALLAEKGWPQGGRVACEDPPGGGIPTYKDPYVEGQVSSPTGEPPVAGSGGPSPGPGGSHAAPQPAGSKIGGKVVYGSYQQGTIQLESIEAAAAGGNPTVLGTHRLSGPGAFQLDVRDASQVVLRAYIDEDMDGPDADDRRFDLSATVIDTKDPGAGALVVDLDAGTVQTGG